MPIENKKIIDDERVPVDVTKLSVGTGYALLREMGPNYLLLTDRVGVIKRRIDIPETGETLVVVNEQVKHDEDLVTITRVRFSTPVVRVGVELVPRPGNRLLVPGVNP